MKEKFKKERGITIIALAITIIILLILAGITINALTGEKRTIKEAHEAKNSTEYQSWEEQIKVAIIDAENKHKEATMDDVIDELKAKKVIEDENQVNKDTGAITTNEPVYLIEGMLDDYLITVGDIYYGDKDAVPTDTKYFEFTYNETTKTAALTGVKDEYREKVYYAEHDVLQSELVDASSAIKDGENYITDIVIPYEVEKDGVKYKVTEIGEAAFGMQWNYAWWYNMGENGGLGTRFPNDKAYTSFILPNTIEKIGSYAFNIIKYVNSIKIPISVTTVGERVFSLRGGGTLDIYCEASSKPSGWVENWDESWQGEIINVHWGS